MFRTVDYLLRPKSIALVGASDSSRGGWVQEIYYNLEFSGFPAKLYLVNPKRRELWGKTGRKVDPTGQRPDGLPFVDVDEVKRRLRGS